MKLVIFVSLVVALLVVITFIRRFFAGERATDEPRDTIARFVAYGIHDHEGLLEQLEELLDRESPERVATILDEEIAKARDREANWPAETDCDRLDAAFAAMDKAGFVAIARAGFTQSDALHDVWDERKYRAHSGSTARGYVFYHTQDIYTAQEGGRMLLGFGSFEEDDSDEAAAAIGREIVAALRTHHFDPKWGGSRHEKIEMPIRWQRRLAEPLKNWAPKDRPYPFDTPAELAGQALFHAAESDDVAKIKEILASGVPATYANEFGDTAMHRSVSMGAKGLAISALIAGGADINARNGRGNTPLHEVASSGSSATLRALLKAGADLTQLDGSGKTALQRAESSLDRYQEQARKAEPKLRETWTPMIREGEERVAILREPPKSSA